MSARFRNDIFSLHFERVDIILPWLTKSSKSSSERTQRLQSTLNSMMIKRKIYCQSASFRCLKFQRALQSTISGKKRLSACSLHWIVTRKLTFSQIPSTIKNWRFQITQLWCKIRWTLVQLSKSWESISMSASRNSWMTWSLYFTIVDSTMEQRAMLAKLECRCNKSTTRLLNNCTLIFISVEFVFHYAYACLIINLLLQFFVCIFN